LRLHVLEDAGELDVAGGLGAGHNSLSYRIRGTGARRAVGEREVAEGARDGSSGSA
jgi:hypothetical protein